jgi:ABC-type transport system involved in cytochrome c biogenesis ATPase subunit
MIRVTNLRRTFGAVVAVDGLTVSFPANQISCLLGHNGAGKTTTISMLTGMIPPTSGEGHVCGFDISTNMADIRNSLGVCPQFDILWPNLTVAEHAEIYASFQGVPKEALATEVAILVNDVGLAEKRNALTATLSGGQKRKLSVVLAFMGRPKVSPHPPLCRPLLTSLSHSHCVAYSVSHCDRTVSSSPSLPLCLSLTLSLSHTRLSRWCFWTSPPPAWTRTHAA